MEIEGRRFTNFDVECAMPFFFDPEEMRHTALKQVVGWIIGIQIIKKLAKRLVWFTGVEHNRIADEIDVPAMKRPVKESFSNFGRTLDVASLGYPCEFGDELFGVVHVLEYVRANGVVKRTITKGKMMRICNHNRAIDDNITATFGIIKEKFVDQNVGTWIGVVATTDFEDLARLGLEEELFHAALIQFIARKAIV